MAPRAPGTFGTLLGWLVFIALEHALSRPIWLGVVVVAFVLGIWACGRTGRDLGVADHGAMVWDEIVAIWLVLIFTPANIIWQLAAFALFRLFDIAKPPPIGWLDRTIKGGLGVMLDDIVAALFALIVVLAADFTWEQWNA
jgi:phosphatidylglycerophosphatase A